MAYDQYLALRIRALLATESHVDEKQMFGGLAFLINGNLAVTANSRGDVMVRVTPEQTDALLEFPHTAPMVMAGRPLRGWIQISADGVATDRQLRRWVTLGSDYASKLPAK